MPTTPGGHSGCPITSVLPAGGCSARRVRISSSTFSSCACLFAFRSLSSRASRINLGGWSEVSRSYAICPSEIRPAAFMRGPK